MERTAHDFMVRMVETYSRVHSPRYWNALEGNIDTDFVKGGIIADLGCGPGLLLRDLGRKFAPKKLVGVDLSPVMLQRAEVETRSVGVDTEFIQQHLQDDPQLKFSAHAIFSSRVLRSFEDQQAIMNSISAALEDGGYLVIVDWIRASIRDYLSWFSQQSGEFENLTPAEVIRYHRIFSRYSLEDWEYIVENHGFEVIHTFQIDAVHGGIIARKL
ncbi:MAG: class I SAM-dependent methyltransferase [Candidatus Kariarchaeaceae archaeon]|jgi:SAM-dependent methyltransferase